MRTIIENWFQTDQVEDVAASTRHAAICLDLVVADPGAWKWLILSLHSALQGACVCHLTTTAEPVGALTDKNTRQWLEFFEASRNNSNLNPPDAFLAPLPELLRRVAQHGSAGGGPSYGNIPLTDTEIRDLNFIHGTFRNQFVHFAPMSWSVEISGLLQLIPVITRIIRSIDTSGWAFRHVDLQWHLDLNSALNQLVSKARDLHESIAPATT